MNKSRVFKRAWKTVKKHNISLSKALKWSWKIENEQRSFIFHKDWSHKNADLVEGSPRYFRRYFKDNSYITYKMDGYYKCAEYSVLKFEGDLAEKYIKDNNEVVSYGFKQAC